MIPVLDLQPEISYMRSDLDAAYHRVMDHGRFIMGPEVRDFEQQAARYLGVKHAIAVNSGTDALLIALRAAGVGQGDEVITTSFTFFATAESIEMAGATPVFIDIEPGDYNMDPDRIEPAITPRTKAIVPVHLFGKPAPMARIMEIAERHGLMVFEDCAQSFGAVYNGTCAACYGGRNSFDRQDVTGAGSAGAGSASAAGTGTAPGATPAAGAGAASETGAAPGASPCNNEWQVKLTGRQTGTIGLAGAFSFFPSKNLGGFGDGGLITTNDDQLAGQAAMLRVHGAKKKYHNEVLGYNSRLDTLQAALLQVKLAYIDEFNERRRRVAHRYLEALSGVDALQLPALPDDGHIYHQFTIQLLAGNRDTFAEALKEKGVQTMVYYPIPVHQLPLYHGLDVTLPVAETVKDRVISLPVGPFLSEEDQDAVVSAVKACL